jgi:hypothetical protein
MTFDAANTSNVLIQTALPLFLGLSFKFFMPSLKFVYFSKFLPKTTIR